MRAGVSTVQQTLTAEAATILKQAVTEACKRGHAQATPLHVAATLLLSPSSPLRRACLQTHSHSSHLPHCRALELCFNIALERLQAAQGPLPNGQPSYSNALVAALKRAQAHQRRGCPEQQQQPLLAVKVELEQLIISILDDPSVSRVMREAGFSSTDVKSHLEETVSLMASHHSVTHSITDPVRLPLSVNAMDQMGFRLGGAPSILGGFPLPHHLTPFGNGTISQERNEMQLHMRPLRTPSPHMNPILLKPGGMPLIVSGGEDTKQVLEVLMRKKKRNPVLLGDSAARVEGVIKDVFQHLERRNVPEQLHGVKVVPANLSFMTLMNASKEDLYMRFLELNKTVQELVLSGGGVVVNVGNLQWLLQLRATASRMAGFCPVQHAAHQIKELYARHQDCNRMWLIGTATHQTFRSCQALYPGLESQWELQPVPIGAVGPGPGPASLPVRCSTQETGTSGTDSLTLSLLPSSATSLHLNVTAEEDGEQLTCCLECSKKYEKEALLLREQEGSKQPDSPQSCSSSVETPSKAPSDQGLQSTCASQPALPLWLQKACSTNAASSVATSAEAKGKALPLATKLLELQKKWNYTCKSLHTERLPGLNVPLDMWQQQPSPPSSHISGNPSGKCQLQDRALSLLRENLGGPGTTRPMVGSHPALNGHSTPRAMASSLAISNMPNGISSDQLLQVSAHRDRVQEDTNGCSASNIRLPWQQAPSAATPMMRNTEAGAPCSASDNAIRGQPSRMFSQMNPEALVQLCKGLAKKVGWQPKIISTIAETVMQCRSGHGKRVGVSSKGDTWLLFLGHDRPGKRMMAEALAELIFGADKKPICLMFGKQQDLSSPATWSLGLTVPSRGKMPLDQLADAMRLHPSSLFYLEDVEQADSMFRSSLLRAMSKGRLVDSSGRDVSLSSVIVVMTSNAGTECSAATCAGSETQLVKDRISEGVARPHSGNEDSASTAGVGRMESSHQQWLLSKRKGGWNADDEPQEKEPSNLNKKPNLGRALDLDLNMAAEENEKVGFSISHAPARDVHGTMKPESSEEEVLLGARKRVGEFCDLVDAAVVFASPL
eukprot:c22754_g1_i1 orf=589-3783(+)